MISGAFVVGTGSCCVFVGTECVGCVASTVDVTLPCLFGNCTTATGVGSSGVVLHDVKCVVDGDGWILLCGTSDCVVNVVVVVVVVPVVSSVRS